MAKFTVGGYHPRIGDRVEGLSGGRLYTGVVLEHPRHPRKPFVFSTPHGCVLCYIQAGNRKVAVNEIRRV